MSYLWLSALLSAHLRASDCNLSFYFLKNCTVFAVHAAFCIHVAPLRPGSGPTSCTSVCESQPKRQKNIFSFCFTLFPVIVLHCSLLCQIYIQWKANSVFVSSFSV